MSGREAASTASALPTVNNVPIWRPSRPSRAISRASSNVASRRTGRHHRIWPQSFSRTADSVIAFQLQDRLLTLSQGREMTQLSHLCALIHTQFVVAREAAAVYGFTAVMASVSFAARCLDIAVTHSPGLTDLTASTVPTGTWNLKVTYWRGDS